MCLGCVQNNFVAREICCVVDFTTLVRRVEKGGSANESVRARLSGTYDAGRRVSGVEESKNEIMNRAIYRK